MLVQVLTMVSRRLRAVADAGERGRRAIELYTRCGAVLLAALQAYGIALALARIAGAVADPPLVFRLSTVLTLTAGTLFLVWLADQITARGIGNGIALVLLVGVVAAVPRDIATLLQASRAGLVSQNALMALALIAALVTLAVVAVERARRRIPIEFATRRVGERQMAGQSVELAFKLNPAGILPALFAGGLIAIGLFAAEIAGLLIAGRSACMAARRHRASLTLRPLAPYRHHGAADLRRHPFVYTAFLHDPERLAERLRGCGGSIPGVAPGEPTADYLDDIARRLTCCSARSISRLMMLLPIALADWLRVPFVVGGASLLVLVCLTLDIEAQVRALMARPG